MTQTESKPTPVWRAIAADLRDEIAAGAWPEASRLPSEAALAARFGVNRHTVRHALSALAGEGLVHSRRGAGVFVTARPTDYPIGRRVRFHRNIAAAGRVPGRQVLGVETRPATAEESRALALPPGAEVHCCDGISLADGQPVAVFRSVFPGALAGLPEALVEENSITRALSRCGVADYTRRTTRLTATAATATQGLHLRLREGAPVLQSVGINVDSRGRPVEYGRTWFAGERVTLTLDAEDSA